MCADQRHPISKINPQRLYPENCRRLNHFDSPQSHKNSVKVAVTFLEKKKKQLQLLSSSSCSPETQQKTKFFEQLTNLISLLIHEVVTV